MFYKIVKDKARHFIQGFGWSADPEVLLILSQTKPFPYKRSKFNYLSSLREKYSKLLKFGI